MRKNKIEIPVLLITLAILALIALSGDLVYKSLSEIVKSWNTALQPNNKRIMVNNLQADLEGLENSVKLYALSRQHVYQNNYYKQKKDIKGQLKKLQKYQSTTRKEKATMDSLISLSHQKIQILGKMFDLHFSKISAHKAFAAYSKRVDTMLVATDTIHISQPPKTGFFKRLFGKKPEAPRPVVLDRSKEKQSVQKEIEMLEKEIVSHNKAFAQKEALLMRKNLAKSKAIEKLITRLEILEKQGQKQKTRKAGLLAHQTYKRLIIFASAVFMLVILVLLIVFRNIKKSRSYQQALQKAKDSAEQLARAKEMFTATVSHEMRTPVNAIYGLTEQMLQKPQDTGMQKDLSVIHQAAKHLNDLVNDTFDFTRIENNRLVLQASYFRIDTLLERIAFYNNEKARAKKIDFSIDKGNTQGLVLYTDERRLSQILNNLTANAIKFTDKGSVSLTANQIHEKEKEWLIFEVTDTGIGISEENQEKIFNDFVQLETGITKKAGGTGLGLYISQKLTELLGGNIALKSALKKGSTFSVKIPFKKGNADKLQQNSFEYHTPDALNEGRVLIVDDEEFNRHLLKNILTKWNIDFDEANDGKQAVKLAKLNRYQLIIMDLRMPVLNGTEAAKQIKETEKQTKIIALSANTNIPEEPTVFDAFLRKPFNEAELYDTIKQTLHAATTTNIIQTKQEQKQLQDKWKDLMFMANDDKNFLKEMIEIFIRSSQNNLRIMGQNISRKDNDAIAETAHKMASPVKQMGFTAAYKTIKAIEKQAQNTEKYTETETLFRELERQINSANKQLQDILSSFLTTN